MKTPSEMQGAKYLIGIFYFAIENELITRQAKRQSNVF